MVKSKVLFNSSHFLFFFLIVFFIQWALVKFRIPRFLFLLIASYYFYMSWNPIFIVLILFSSAVDYITGYFIYKNDKKSRKRIFLFISLLSNLGLLFVFKYYNFFGSIVNDLSILLGGAGNIFIYKDITLPVGISFYTFQTLSYTIDIYKGKLKPHSSIIEYALYVSFFPQLVAGPIVRASEFLPQLQKPANVDQRDMTRGLFLIMTGLIKKVVIADYIAVNLVDRVFSQPLNYSSLENLFGVYAYALQIYCDFSGYSDIAIGTAAMMGFVLPLNFNVPYNAVNIRDFWNRWHISLSTWLKDYLYISMGGNRKGRIRTYINLAVTMLLGGLWHGAAWTFIIWGALHGFYLILTRMFHSIIPESKNRVVRFLGFVVTFHFVCLTWIFFRSPNFDIAKDIISQIWAFEPGYANIPISVLILMAIGYFAHFLPRKAYRAAERTYTHMNPYLQAIILFLILAVTYKFSFVGVVPFIYFQF